MLVHCHLANKKTNWTNCT